MRRVYISGPMSGLPEFNYPAFMAAAAVLEQLGAVPLNPATNPAPACGTWSGWMRLALALLVQADAVLALPGWRQSRGARLEILVADVLGIPVFYSVDQYRSAALHHATHEG